MLFERETGNFSLFAISVYVLLNSKAVLGEEGKIWKLRSTNTGLWEDRTELKSSLSKKKIVFLVSDLNFTFHIKTKFYKV